MRFLMLTRQTAALSTCITNILRVPHHLGREEGPYISYMKTELADMLAEIEGMCDLLDIEFVDTYTLGVKRREEKEEQFKKRYPNVPWI